LNDQLSSTSNELRGTNGQLTLLNNQLSSTSNELQ